MQESERLGKAQLVELKADLTDEDPEGKKVEVQFNPETLKVSFANQVATPTGTGDQSSGTAGQQFVGAGSTKLSLQLWFDVTAPIQEAAKAGEGDVSDVRKLTKNVAYFITPKPDNADPTKFLPPGVRFIWGSFQFDGIMESMEENLEFFSSEGVPLRASVSINLSQQRITAFSFRPVSASPNARSAGTRPMTRAQSGSTVQGLAVSQGKGDDWQSIAERNEVENPRLLQPGQLLDMNLRKPLVTI